MKTKRVEESIRKGLRCVLYKLLILFLTCYRKSANFLGVPVRISQNHKILHNTSKLFLKKQS